MGLIGTTNEEKIWNYLYSKLKNNYGVAGLIGNLKAESGLSPINLQNTGNTKLGMTDEQYTNAVNNNSYTNFIKDSQGYGLAQWTYWNRKQNLLDYAKSKGVSIGDLEMQLDFLVTKELQVSYKSVWNKLLNATSVRQASDVVLTEFEKPANQSESVKITRAKYGQESYDKFATKTNNKEVSPLVNISSSTYLNETIHGIKVNTSVKCSSTNYQTTSNRQAEYIVIHYTGNSKDVAVNNAKYFQGANRKASAHFFVDDTSIYQSVDLKDSAWHCGASNYRHAKCRNLNSIGIEMCCTDGNYMVSSKTQENTAYLCARLCKILGISASQVDTYVLTHNAVTGKTCPRQYVNNPSEFTAFKKMVKDILNNGSVSSAPASNTSSDAATTSYVHNGIDYSLVFNPTFYANRYGDLKKAFGSDSKKLFNHFVQYGMKEGRVASVGFNVQAYKSRYLDLQNAFGSNLPKYYEHYIRYGEKEKRTAI